MKTMQKSNMLASGSAIAIAVAANAVCAGGVAAQDEIIRDEIVVTATGREERTIDVPYNISAIDGAEIAKNRILDSAELLRSVAGVSLPDKGPRNASVLNQVVMRGINVDGGAFGDYSVSTVTPVSTYINNTPLFAAQLIRDVNRVEVLRGPQGTLYGSGAMGGTVRYILNQPELGENSLYVRGGITKSAGSSDVGWDGDVVINLALGENLALRFAGAIIDTPGIIDLPNAYLRDANGVPVPANGDILSTEPVFERVVDSDFYKSKYGRLSLNWEPTENIQFVLSGVLQDDESGGRRAETVGVDGFGREYERYELGTLQLEPYTRELAFGSLEATVNLGFATLTSTTSYYDNNGFSNSENSGFYTQAAGGAGFWAYYFFYPRPEAAANRLFGDKAFTQEIRLVSSGNKHFDYIIGGFYQDQELLGTQDSFLTGFVEWCNVSPACFYRPYVFADGSDFHYRRDETFTDKAIFGELTWHVTDTLDVTGGLRAFWNKDDNRTEQSVSLYTFLRELTIRERVKKENDVLYKANISWRFHPDQMIYATTSTGYRRGGINAVPTTGFFAEDPIWEPYDSDTVTNYEIGVKGRLFNNLTYDADIFYINWKDTQYNTGTTLGFFATANAESAHSYGAEFALDGYFSDDTHFTLGYSFTNAELTADVVSPVGVTSAFDGDRLPTIPKHMLTGSIDHTYRIDGDDSLYFRVAGFYQSDIRNSIGLRPPQVPVARFNTRLPGFAIFNSSATWTHGPMDVTFYVKNIFNERGVTAEFTNAYMGNSSQPQIDNYYGNGSKQYLSQPRTFGLSIGRSF